MTELDAGTIVDGRYKVLSRLGSGGMADVFLVEDEQLGRQVALKLLHRRFAADPGFVERFRREAQAAAGLQHPNIVAVYDRGEFDGTYYIAMEYLPGPSLKQLIRREAPLEPVRAIDIAVQILKAARFAHRRGVIHRDLKPHNVIVGDGDHAKVTDFGIARAGASDMTETGSIMGTAQYLSPEQAQGHTVHETSDLYSVGIVLYEMLTGRVPFDAEAAVSIALKHVSEAPLPPTAINPSIPPDLEQVVLWSLNKNPDDRPADADQFISVLEQVREGIISGERGEITASMAAVAAGAAAGGLAAAVPTAMMPADAAGAYALAQYPELNGGQPYGPDGGDPHRDGRDRGSRVWPWIVLLLVLLAAAGGAAAYFLTRPPKVVVPPVVGEMQDSATATLSNFGFTPNVINETSTARAGTVIAQTPQPGVKADKGSTVTLTVSQGPGDVTVPPVSQLSQKAAEHEITRVGLKVARLLSESSGVVANGFATRSDPPAGTPLQLGTGVTLYISSGKPNVSVPDVTGDTAAQARATLGDRGFSVSSSNQPSSTATVGTVISQTPSGGSSAQQGSPVHIVIAVAQPTVAIPNVVGQGQKAARAALTSLGFTVVKTTTPVTDRTQHGKVVSQTPAPGTKAKQGSPVTIVVGHYQASKTPTGTTTTPTTTTPTTTTPTTTTPAATT
jgi:serine/threonine-protein kinase